MSLKDEIENAMLLESYGDRISSIASLVDMQRDDVLKMIKNIDFSDWVDLLRALRDQDADAAKAALLPSQENIEEYNMGGTRSPAEMRAAKAAQQQQAEPEMPTQQQRIQRSTQGMQRLGRDNLGGVTAQQAASAVDQAAQQKPLTPMQRKALAQQASAIDALAQDPRTASQLRQLMNRLKSGR